MSEEWSCEGVTKGKNEIDTIFLVEGKRQYTPIVKRFYTNSPISRSYKITALLHLSCLHYDKNFQLTREIF